MRAFNGKGELPDREDPDWVHYPNTILVFAAEQDHPGRIPRVDLRAPVAARDIALLESLGLSEPFAVITAHDPHGRDLDEGENATRETRLKEQLAERGAYFVEVDACSPDRAHCERSVAVTLPFDDAVALAREYGQMAIFWFDGQRFWIVGGVADSDPILLPRAP